MKRIFTFMAAAMLLSVWAWAVPAKPGFRTVSQSDGSTLQIQLLGDEFHHSLATADRLTIEQGADGDYYYCSARGITTMRAHDAAHRSAAELAFLSANRDQFTMTATMTAAKRARAQKAAARRALTQVPTMGSPRVPIILVEYTDKKMSNTKAQFESHYKTGSKSVFQYFKDQSNGKYTPQFDIYGIYPLPSSRATYGRNSGSDDVGVALMVNDAIDKAGDDIDWSQYDNDGDGEADVCIVVYAGVGEAQAPGTVPSSVWPCQWTLSEGLEYGDGRGTQTRNGVTIDKFAVFNEVAGSSDRGTTLDGVGTFCHEFSHCLGLPDFYCTTYSGYYGMGNWSLMDNGCYNGGSVDGDTPIGYSAYEKAYMNWIEFINPIANTQYTLPVFNSKSIETDQAIKITALNENEYWILENRKQQGWDQYIPDEGVMITHFTYIYDRWQDNTPNNKSVQLATIIPADNSLSNYNENKDLYGDTNHEFGPTTTPAMKANMTASGTLASSTGGAGVVDKPVTDIYLNSDGTATLWYMKGEIVKEVPQFIDTIAVASTSFTAHWNAVNYAQSYTLQVNDVTSLPPYETLIVETFPAATFNLEGTEDLGSKLDNYMENAGWTGSKVFKYNGGVKLGSGSGSGKLVSPALSVDGFDKVSFIVNVKSYGTDSNVQYKVSYGNQSYTYTATSAGEQKVVTFDAVADGKVTIETTASRKRIVITYIEICAGDAAAASQAPHRAQETGDASQRTITGITDTSYTVTGLNENALYSIKVKAVYDDGTESAWSTPWKVQLFGEEQEGDVNLDGVVDVTDVNIVINIILGNDQAENYDRRAYITDDDDIDVSDVNALINIILSKN
ncbi:MAG: M6 family metalloprotease domain-containing protein [Muribaculaceae bacterium]|nr:M6 family metalloprotease domain-containing protein [Muribaculaceae bacterium]